MSSHTLENNTWDEAFNTFEKSVSTWDEHVEIINGTNGLYLDALCYVVQYLQSKNGMVYQSPFYVVHQKFSLL